jgi:hypothetical protein
MSRACRVNGRYENAYVVLVAKVEEISRKI